MKTAAILSKRTEEILRAIHFYRFMTAQDVCRLLYSPKSITYVREILSSLAGGQDYSTNQYLYRFALPHVSRGNTEKIYALGSRGRKFLANELGLPVESYFRPNKLKHLSYAGVYHALALSRFLVGAQIWGAKHSKFKLSQVRICYELANQSVSVEESEQGKIETLKLKVIPDAYLLFEKRRNGKHEHYYPVLLEVDRGMEHQRRFLRHIHSRLEFIKQGGEYNRLFNTTAVTVAYITSGERTEYRQSRRRAMCTWTNELLKQLGKSNWAPLFKFCSFGLEEIYEAPFFDEPIWYRPDSPTSVTLFTP